MRSCRRKRLAGSSPGRSGSAPDDRPANACGVQERRRDAAPGCDANHRPVGLTAITDIVFTAMRHYNPVAIPIAPNRIEVMAAADRLFAEARRQMVLTQLLPNKVIDERVIAAMSATPREQFVPKDYRGVAYLDEDIVVARGQGKPARALMEPLVLARLLQEADVQPGDVALVVGCATGYDLAVLARLASTAIGLESDAALAAEATRLLAELGLDNAPVIEGPLAQGLAKQGPYNVILAAGALPEIPEVLKQQLAEGGRLVAVRRPAGAPIGQAVVVKRIGELFVERVVFDAGTRPLPGFERPAGFVF